MGGDTGRGKGWDGVWDAVVVGAGPAGCAAAYDLAAAGLRVLLVDKAEFPRAKACAGGLTMKAVRALRYSIAPVVRNTVQEIHLEHESAPGGRITVRRKRPVCVMTVRAELDAYCLEQTCRRGAVFRRIGPLVSLREERDLVVLGIEGESPVRARLLLGADGVHSRVRALAGEAAWFRRGFAMEANVPYSATGREFPLVFDFGPVQGGYGWLFPRNDHVNVGLYTAGEGGVVGVDREALVGRGGLEARGGVETRVDREALIERAAQGGLEARVDRGSREGLIARDARFGRDARDAQDARVGRDARDGLDARGSRKARVDRGGLEGLIAQDARDAQDARGARDARVGRGARNAQDARVGRGDRDARGARDAQVDRVDRDARDARIDRIDRAALTAYIAERCGTGEHERAVGQFLGLGAAGYAPSGRVLLAGDAGGFVDPLTGEGIYGAIASGQAAAAAMEASLRDGGKAGFHYGGRLRRLREDLAVAEGAARRFYVEPARGFRLMKQPLVRRAVLHSYSEGGSLALLARGIGIGRRVSGWLAG